MDLDYPQPGFHFLVVFELLPQFPNDVRFQEVTGLTVSTEFEAWPEGGENRFAQPGARLLPADLDGAPRLAGIGGVQTQALGYRYRE